MAGFAALLLALGGALLPAAAAHAAELQVTSHQDGQFVSGGAVGLAGTGRSGATLTVSGPGLTTCSTTVTDSGWRCDLRLPNGATRLTVTQSGPDASATATPPPPEESKAPAAAAETVTLTLRSLSAPAVDGSGRVLTTGIISGSAYPGAGVVVRTTPAAGGATVSTACPVAGSDGAWSCPLVLPTGDYTISVAQFAPDAPDEISPWSAPRPLTIDRDPPAAPTIDSPRDGQTAGLRDVAFSGTGEEGATVDVFAEGAPLCSASVAGGAWSCIAGLPPRGDHLIQAIQRDAAGNYSTPSAPLRLSFASVTTPSPTPAPTSPPSATPSPSDPAPSPPAGPGAPGGGSGGSGGGAPGGQGGSGGAPTGTGWDAPTAFGSGLPSLVASVTGGGTPLALLGALVFILVVALPLRLLAGATRGRLRLPALRLFGRNASRPVTGPDDDPAPPRRDPRMALTLLLLGATVVVALASGLQGEARDARLLGAILVGLVLVNGIGVVLTSRIASRALGIRRALRLVPLFLVAAALGAVVSRTIGMEPPVVVGVVLAAAAVGGAAPRAAAVLQLAQVGVLATMAGIAWSLHDALGPPAGFWQSAVSETLATVCIAGFGSVLLLLLPVARMPGRAVFEWSPGVWAASTLVAVGFAALALGGAEGFPLLPVLLGALGVGALSLGGWAWIRWVEPSVLAR